MNLSDFNYLLPVERIAQEPLKERDQSRLMVLDRASETIEHRLFNELPELLPKNALLVLNDSCVIPARLRFSMGNGKGELLLVRKITDADHRFFVAPSSTPPAPLNDKELWECMVRPGGKLKEGVIVRIDDELSFTVESIQPHYGLRVIRFACDHFDEYLERHGEMPIPPYIQTPLQERERYQTTYAKEKGSVAAPTAGLHFTESLFTRLKAKGIDTAFVTLHVGLGTFQPVKTEVIEEHAMHSEWFTLSEATAQRLNQAKREGRPIVAVGTTAVRVLESCADDVGASFDKLRMTSRLRPQMGETKIFIYPGYRFKFVDQLITNFHLPKSTLLMLVSALAGREFILKAYQEAIDQKYRFFSFGDAMLIK